ncbi:signal recognition particle GTPase [Candidatus Photodesmus blepharus]|uniref:Signal recognition particle protein n=1 Tax=Candidatus Photodesmus blepharonis TaxID=1179155 RepID=A0A084CP57_9GAMM|nr:signal recognition particle protein [Candidatus Photodesmus blepharus]KEY91586.1 signal recognition particle GTPase [Candidatus Photodesmus blepharus]
MFENLSNRLAKTLKHISGKGRLTEDNIKNTLREIRVAFLEADVALPVIRDFIKQVKKNAIGIEVSKSLTPGQEFIRIVQAELEMTMGKSNVTLELATQPPAVILMVGLQGAGKTTSVGKLSKLLTQKNRKKVLVVSTDIYRPAAINQLETIAYEIGIDFFPSSTNQKPVDIANAAIIHAKKKFYDILLVDTAGRLAIDHKMITEIQSIHNAVSPVETLFVVDAMTGQDAANVAKMFGDALPLTGIILTKIDADARGGAALSVRHITGKPIKFLGTGEKSDALEAFHPNRIASRILGMGDILSLIEDLQNNVNNEKKQKADIENNKKKEFDLEDFREQLEKMQNIGGLTSIMNKLPTMNNFSSNLKNVDDKVFKQMEVIINSMTMKERQYPEIIKRSRKKRIAAGSGTQIQDVNHLLKQFTQMRKMMQKMKKVGMTGIIRNMQEMTRGSFNPFRS